MKVVTELLKMKKKDNRCETTVAVMLRWSVRVGAHRSTGYWKNDENAT